MALHGASLAGRGRPGRRLIIGPRPSGRQRKAARRRSWNRDFPGDVAPVPTVAGEPGSTEPPPRLLLRAGGPGPRPEPDAPARRALLLTGARWRLCGRRDTVIPGRVAHRLD